MKKILVVGVKRKHYRTKVCVFDCIDRRCRRVTKKLLEAEGYERPDFLTLAGGAVLLSGGTDKGIREFVFSQIEATIILHGVEVVVVSTHIDCGACGGLKAFGGSETKARKFHLAKLRSAKRFLQRKFAKKEFLKKVDGRKITVRAIFMDFEDKGTFEV